MKTKKKRIQIKCPHETPGIFSAYLKYKRFHVASKEIPSNCSVLDLGCGQARILDFLGPIKEYLGIDYVTPPKVRHHKNVKFLQKETNVETLNKLKKKFDCILCLAFLEHVEKADLFISAMSKLLRPNGIIIITTPHPVGRLFHNLGSKLGLFSPTASKEHKKFLNKKDFIEIAKQKDLKLIKYKKFLMGFNQLVVFSLKH